ncbi:hypothetical protein T190_11280 [Sinorhizobium meliloti CCBAU 01290]|nr:hypothetical protein T190_11280 [Sinorhizobium meliloti CCBAU 01290]
MAGYGDNDAFTAYATAAGYVFPDGTYPWALRFPLFARADDAAPLAAVLDNGPEEADLSVC